MGSTVTPYWVGAPGRGRRHDEVVVVPYRRHVGALLAGADGVRVHDDLEVTQRRLAVGSL
jgi:hypothetical protein